MAKHGSPIDSAGNRGHWTGDRVMRCRTNPASTGRCGLRPSIRAVPVLGCSRWRYGSWKVPPQFSDSSKAIPSRSPRRVTSVSSTTNTDSRGGGTTPLTDTGGNAAYSETHNRCTKATWITRNRPQSPGRDAYSKTRPWFCLIHVPGFNDTFLNWRRDRHFATH